MTLRSSEWIVVGYLLYLAGTAALIRPVTQRVRFGAEALALLTAVVCLSRYEGGVGLAIRNWAPVAYIVAMYWIPARLVSAPHLPFERMLTALDRRWTGVDHWTLGDRTPRWIAEALELTYLLCYPLIPLGMACLWLGGAGEEADRYWTAVLLSAGLCYGVLPWIATRPPRTTAMQSTVSAMRAVNLRVLRHGSVQWNTFPSGHVATAFAAALAVAWPLPVPGAVLLLLAFGIAAASFVGRYHYAADIAAGAFVAVLAFAASRLA